MDTLATPNGWATPADAEAISLPRRHVIAIAALVCIPVPVLSLAATFVPLPQLLDRAAASFASIALPSEGGDGLIRGTRTEAGALEILYRSGEAPPKPGGPTASSASTRPAKASSVEAQVGEEKPGTTHRARGDLASQPLSTGEEYVSVGTPEPAAGAPSAPDDRSDGPSSGGASPAETAGGGSPGGSSPGGTTSGTSGGKGSGAGSDGTAGGSDSGKGSGPGSGSGSDTGGSGSSGGSNAGGSTASEPPKADPPAGAGSGGQGEGGAPAEPPRSNATEPPVGKGGR